MKKSKRFNTGFLFSTPGFLSGAGTVMNLAGNYYGFNVSSSESEADFTAIKNDWDMIGQDMNDVLDNIITNTDHFIDCK